MSDKNTSKRFKSIAIKLNSIFVSKMFFKFLILDIIFVLYLYGLKYVENQYIYFENIIICIGSVQFLMLLKEIIFGTQRIRKVLKPLNDIAESTQRLSDINFDETSIQSLEEAISKISPEGSSEKVHTGDSELSGIEEAINNLLERMREAYRRQARFVSDASHELRTPIAVIQGYVNMLDRWGKDDKKVLDESIEAIKSESDNMEQLVEQLLFLARGINGKTKVDFKEFSMRDMIIEIYEESKMIDEDHVYIFKDNEDVKAYGDVRLIKETARILIENAKKYSSLGGNIKIAFGKGTKDEVYFYVQDNGIGIKEQDISHIFERFFRSDSSRGRKTGGTGLGLSIAKWIIDNHKGYFSVISRNKIGTRITVYIKTKIN